MNPRYPIYIPSRSRADTALTPRYFDEIGVPYRLVVEADQADAYAKQFSEERLIILDAAYQDDYDAHIDLDASQSKGSGPARNFIWDHSIAEGAPWHWVMDDNIRLFARLHKNQRIPVGDGTIFHAMETFCLRYANVGMAGPNYWMFAKSRDKLPPFVTGTRIYSCNLIRNDLPFRWHGRYNEDTILSLDMLKAGWNTVQFNAFLQYKTPTQQMTGGNMEAFYASEGTLPKSQMLVRLHPDVCRVTWRFNRWHHYADYSRFNHLGLIRHADYDASTEPDYHLTLA